VLGHYQRRWTAANKRIKKNEETQTKREVKCSQVKLEQPACEAEKPGGSSSEYHVPVFGVSHLTIVQKLKNF
jgi:sRNA-binding protein